MSVNLSIKGVPKELAERLRARAERNHRSLQGELMSIIQQAVVEVPAASSLPAAGEARRGEVIVRQGTKSVAQIAAELRALFPEPVAHVPSSVDILRELRDSR